MRRLPRKLVVFLVLTGGIMLSGCATFKGPGATDSAASLSESASATHHDVALASYDESTAEQKSDGPLQLADFSPANFGTTVKKISGFGPDRELARQRYDEAESLYREAVAARSSDQGDLSHSVFLNASGKYLEAAERWPDSALEEDAMFRAGECQFFADRYVKANEQFEALLKKYPNSRYLDLVGARRFVIAQYWLKLNANSNSYTLGLNPLDKQRPWSDTFGHAIRIYDRMRLDDPTGKLADDATIAAGNALFAKGDYEGADQYYSDLRTNFPSSEHQFMAHYLGIQAKIRGYRGPEYAGEGLADAEKLIKQVRRQFPKESGEHREEIEKAYREVRYRKAEREWTMADYYNKRHDFGAARFYYDVILSEYDDTPFADKARARVPEISDKPRIPPQRLSWLVELFPDGRSAEPMMATAPDDTKLR